MKRRGNLLQKDQRKSSTLVWSQDNRQMKGVQDMELDGLVMIVKQEHVDLGGMVGDFFLDVAVESSNRDQIRKRKMAKA